VRGGGMNVYAGAERIDLAEQINEESVG
jgi:hypothetical protein